MTDVVEYAAFAETTEGGNPAGVVLDARGLDPSAMQRIAAEVGHSETAFLFPSDTGDPAVRYFSPVAEVSFCGHATVALAAAHAESTGAERLRLRTLVGDVEVVASVGDAGVSAGFTTVPTRTARIDPVDVERLLAILGWTASDLDAELPPRLTYAGAWHPVLAAHDRGRLAVLDYDFEALRALMLARGWTTVNIVHREGPLLVRARNPFPVGGVVEDPATGAAAAALGGYLRELELLDEVSTLEVRQGVEMGRPSRIDVRVGARAGGVEVSGRVVRL